jgi:carbamoyltransferase
MKDRVNRMVKNREEFRPFAPAVVEERASEFFETDRPLPFMIVVLPVREAHRARLPAVTHVDGTARIQTVSLGTNPRFHALLTAFGARTGVPVLLNTSFNLQGEPIVCTPADAVRTFYASGLDALALGPFLLEKAG